MKKLREEPMGKATMTTEKMEQKEVKTELPAAPVIEGRMCETGESLLQSQEVGTKSRKSKKKMSQTEGCINKDDAEWYQENINGAFDQLKKGLLQDEQMHALIEKFMSKIRRSMQHIKLQPEIELAEI